MIRSLLVSAGLCLATLLLPAPAQAAYCWCHPLYPGNPGACGTVWVVWQGGLIGFTEVFRGSPPPDEWVAQSLLPPICPEPSCTFQLLLDDGHGCSATPPLATPVASNWKSHQQVVYWQKKAAEIRRLLVQSRGWLSYYCTQAPGPHAKGMCAIMTKVVGALTIDLVAYVAAAMDPPNMDYAVIPAMCTQSGGPPLTMADITWTDGVPLVTAPQLAAINAWLAKRLEVDNIHCQMVDTWERTSGAVLALQAGDVAAEPWIGDLARRYDALKATVITAAAQERALRTTALAPFPSEPVPAACPEPTAYEQVILAAAAAGMDLYQARQAAALMAGPCVPAATWPAFLFADVADEVALYADFATVSLAATVCTHTGICAPPPATLTVTSPNGGGTLTTGQVVPLTWTTTGLTGGTVRIKLARDGKNFSELIHAAAPNTGSYAWKVSGPFTTAARVWIRSNTAAAAVDASDGKSTINGLIVLWPNGGNKLTIGTTKTITWSSSGCVGPVDIKIGRNGVWARAFSEYVPNTGSKSWTVSGPASTQARVRIRCTTAPLLIDTSDGVFTIQ